MEQQGSVLLAQLYTFAEAVLAGFILSACYDVYRAFRMQWGRTASFILVAADLTFCLLAAGACLLFFIYLRWAEIYFYSYLGLAGGLALYSLLLSRYLLFFWVKLFSYLTCQAAHAVRGLKRVYKLIQSIHRGGARKV